MPPSSASLDRPDRSPGPIGRPAPPARPPKGIPPISGLAPPIIPVCRGLKVDWITGGRLLLSVLFLGDEIAAVRQRLSQGIGAMTSKPRSFHGSARAVVTGNESVWFLVTLIQPSARLPKAIITGFRKTCAALKYFSNPPKDFYKSVTTPSTGRSKLGFALRECQRGVTRQRSAQEIQPRSQCLTGCLDCLADYWHTRQ